MFVPLNGPAVFCENAKLWFFFCIFILISMLNRFKGKRYWTQPIVMWQGIIVVVICDPSCFMKHIYVETNCCPASYCWKLDGFTFQIQIILFFINSAKIMVNGWLKNRCTLNFIENKNLSISTFCQLFCFIL